MSIDFLHDRILQNIIVGSWSAANFIIVNFDIDKVARSVTFFIS